MNNRYSQQILALVAAASCNADMTTVITYGCSMTLVPSAVYKVILPTGLGVVNKESFTRVSVKASSGTGVIAIVSDESDTIKSITVFDNNGAPAVGGLEITVERTVANF
jgi:hypothetical protein